MFFTRTFNFIVLFLAGYFVLPAQEKQNNDVVYFETGSEFNSPHQKRQEARRLYQVAVNRYNQQEYEIAIELLDQAVYLEPAFSDAYFQRAAASERLLFYNDALRDYEILLNLSDSMNEAYFGKGRMHYLLENYEEALEVFVKLLDRPSGNTNAVYFKTPRYASGQSGVVGITTLQSNQADIYNYQGLCYLNLKQWESALDAFDEALKLQDDHPDYLLNKAICLKESGRIKAAMEALTDLLEKYPEHELGWYNLAVLAGENGKNPETLGKLNKSLGAINKIPSAYLNRGIIKYNAGDFEGAHADFDSAVALEPGDTDFLMNRAMAREKLGLYELALQDLEKVLSQNDRNTQAYKITGDVKFHQELYEAAIASYSMAIAYQPYNPAALYNRGLSFLKIKEWKRGCQDLKQSMDYGNEASQKLIRKYCR